MPAFMACAKIVLAKYMPVQAIQRVRDRLLSISIQVQANYCEPFLFHMEHPSDVVLQVRRTNTFTSLVVINAFIA